MLWVFLAFTGALSNAAFYIIIRNHIRDRDPRILTALGFLLAAVLLLILSALQGFPAIGPAYYSAIVISAVLNIAGLSLIFRAMESSDLSRSMPMLAFTPVFLVGTSFLLLHEVPSAAGSAGICIIVSGSYVLNISAGHEHILDPVRSMTKDRGSWYMLIVALLFAASINYDKIAMLNSDPVFGMTGTLLIISAGFAAMVFYSPRPAACPSRHPAERDRVPPSYLPEPAVSLRSNLVPAILAGIFASVECVSINYAYTLQIAPYVIAIKRFSIIVMVLYGTIICAEDEIRNRFAGSLLMVGGAVIILLFT